MTPVVVPYEHGDAGSIYGSIYSELFVGPAGLPDNIGDMGPAFTAVDSEGRIIGCAGVILMWENTGHAWAAFGELFPKYPIFMSKVVRNIMNEIISDNDLERVETLVESTNERNMRWATKFLGFSREGTLRNYYHGLDFEMVAIIR